MSTQDMKDTVIDGMIEIQQILYDVGQGSLKDKAKALVDELTDYIAFMKSGDSDVWQDFKEKIPSIEADVISIVNEKGSLAYGSAQIKDIFSQMSSNIEQIEQYENTSKHTSNYALNHGMTI